MRIGKFFTFIAVSLCVPICVEASTATESAAQQFSEPVQMILDHSLEADERVEKAMGLLSLHDPVIADELFDAAVSIDLEQDLSGLTVAYKVIQKYWEFRVNSADSREEKVILLLDALEVNGDRRFGWVRTWAAFQLCDLGLSFAWSSIEREIGGRSDWSHEQLARCRRKIEFVEACDGDYIRAWEMALKTEDIFSTRPIHSWAERGLRRSTSKEAGKVLLRFYVPQLPGSFWILSFISDDLRENGWTVEEIREFGWTGRIPRSQ